MNAVSTSDNIPAPYAYLVLFFFSFVSLESIITYFNDIHVQDVAVSRKGISCLQMQPLYNVLCIVVKCTSVFVCVCVFAVTHMYVGAPERRLFANGLHIASKPHRGFTGWKHLEWC